MRDYLLFHEDFKAFGIGEFPYDRDHSASGEYQYVTEEGYHGRWLDRVCNYTYNGHGPSWMITEDDGTYYMESCRIEKGKPHRTFPTLQTGEREWAEYDVSVSVRRLSTKGMAGLAFCLNDSIDTLVFSMEYRDRVRLAYRHKEEVIVLAEADFVSESDPFYRLEVSVTGSHVTCSIDGKVLLEADTGMAERGGRIGITADCPTQFTEVRVLTEAAQAQAIASRKLEAKAREQALQAQYPKMKLWKKIDLQNFGTSRQIRFGHLTGTKDWYLVIPQAQKRVDRDSYCHISCITALDMDGNILWQRGVPSENAAHLGKISADFPIQVYDIDGDGIDEVITAHNFKLQILDGRTGKVKKSVPTPLSDDDDSTLIGVPYQTYAFDRLNPDGIRIANFRVLTARPIF